MTDAAPPRIGLTQVRVKSEATDLGSHNITNEAGSSIGTVDMVTLSGTFGSARPPRLLSVVVEDEDNGDEVYGYCDTLTFHFDMSTDKAGRNAIDVTELAAFANPVDPASPECDVPFGGG